MATAQRPRQASKKTWTVPASVLRVVDGDTMSLLLDLGWEISLRRNCRMSKMYAPELSTPEGKLAKAYAETLLLTGKEVMFVSHSLDKYGRPLGEIFIDGVSFNQAMVAAGHATVTTTLNGRHSLSYIRYRKTLKERVSAG